MPGLKANGVEMNWNSQGNDWNKYPCKIINKLNRNKHNIVMKVKKKNTARIQHTNKKKRILQYLQKKNTNVKCGQM